MKRIGVVVNLDKPVSRPVLRRLTERARNQQLELVTIPQVAAELPEATIVSEAELAAHVDIVVALGGDGTMLHAVRMLNGGQAPVLGVNLGSLGFMTSVTEEAFEHALDVVVAGRYKIYERTLLQCRVERQGEEVAEYVALNDVVAGWGSSSRAMTLRLAIDGEEVAQYLCDGLIVSTPTGSTGHSLSAGGPIVHPAAPVFCVNVICPHTLSARPLVLSDQAELAIHVQEIPADKQPLLSADGQGEFVLDRGDVLRIRRHDHVVRFLHLPEYSYFAVLRQKLHWRGSVLP